MKPLGVNWPVCFALFLFAPFVSGKCSDYQGFWVADYDKPDHRDFIEFFYGADLHWEMRESYYQKPGQKNTLHSQGYGRMKDSLGVCFQILDTARQVDSNQSPVGPIYYGQWYVFEDSLKVIAGIKRIFEVTADTIKDPFGITTVYYDTVDVQYISNTPAFTNPLLFQWSSPNAIRAVVTRAFYRRHRNYCRVDGRANAYDHGMKSENH